MVRKQSKSINFGDILENAINKVDAKRKGIDIDNTDIIDIFTFVEYWCEIELFPFQKLALKLLYYGSEGNKNIKFTQEDFDFVNNINNYGRGNPWLLEKIEYVKKHPACFREMILVLGRRSGKSRLTSICPTYETYKLLNRRICPKCRDIPKKRYKKDDKIYCREHKVELIKDPQIYYGLPPGESIYIINTATSAEQAKDPMFKYIEEFIYKIDFFKDKIGGKKEDPLMLSLLTDTDKEFNKKAKEYGLPERKGSVILMAGSSNATALAGKSSICVIFDEMGKYISEGQNTAGKVYKELEPLNRRFTTYRTNRNKPEGPDNLPRNDGKIIAISTPVEANGKFFELYATSNNKNTSFMMQLPSWEANPYETEEALRQEHEASSDTVAFDQEYGAQFGITKGDPFFPADLVDRCFSTTLNKQNSPSPGRSYKMFVDFATKSDNYAMMIGNMENANVEINDRFGHKKNVKALKFFEVFSKIWKPNKRMGVQLNPVEIIEEIIEWGKIFKVCIIGFDNMLSIESTQTLKKHGFMLKNMSFSGYNKSLYYKNLKDLMIVDKVVLCQDDELLKTELKNLEVEYTAKSFRVKKSPGMTDDLADCLAALCFMTHSEVADRLPRIQVANTTSLTQSTYRGSIFNTGLGSLTDRFNR